jgi:SAM-dependent methyltransferase
VRAVPVTSSSGTRCFLEAVNVDEVQGIVAIDGWAIDGGGGPVQEFRVSFGGRDIPSFELRTGMPSPDVQAALPELRDAGHVRFSIRASLGADVPAGGSREVVLVPLIGGRPGAPVSAEARRSSDVEQAKWFHEHYTTAADQILSFLAADGIELRGKQVADVGCGDGINDLGIAHQAVPATLIGFDVAPVDVEALRVRATAQGVPGELPPCLRFQTSEPRRLPARDASFDVAFTWSAFEHFGDPTAVACEMRRVLRPGGVAFVQVWPFFHSQHGSHLWAWFPEGFAHLLKTTQDLGDDVRGRSDPRAAAHMLGEYDRLNRMTVDELQLALQTAGFIITRVQLVSEPIRIPPALAHVPLSKIAISGVKLLAVPRPR